MIYNDIFEDAVKPKDGERYLVYDSYFDQIVILTYNDFHNCWDDGDGEDYYCDFDRARYWTEIPEMKFTKM